LNIDEIDRKILKEYSRDARLSFREIANRINVAVGTVLSRTKKMEKDGVIQNYTVLLNNDKLGYPLTAVTEINTSSFQYASKKKKKKYCIRLFLNLDYVDCFFKCEENAA
jgi:DNA-binding Lrp family transcriptional regulator